jgi:hypothetical protein
VAQPPPAATAKENVARAAAAARDAASVLSQLDLVLEDEIVERRPKAGPPPLPVRKPKVRIPAQPPEELAE